MCNRERLKSVVIAVAITCIGSTRADAAERTVYVANSLLGSPIAAMSEQGEILWRESYSPFGVRQVKSPQNSAKQAYTGKPEDPDTGYIYMGARVYDPDAGRFAGVDPQGVKLTNAQSFSRYAYANNSPYVFVDPDGREGVEVSAVQRATTKLTKAPLSGSLVTNKKQGATADGRFDPEGGTYRSRPHYGVDISASTGEPVMAAGDGRVVAAGGAKGLGNRVEIYHGDAVSTRSAHLDTISVKEKDVVRAGDVIGTVGRSGNVPDGAKTHLHFEIVVGSSRIDPEEIFNMGHEE